MKSIINLLNWINDNWTYILIIITLVITIWTKVKKFLSMSKEDKKKEIMRHVKEEILKLMSDAELNWAEFDKSGKIKRSEVINEIYTKYPELSKLKNQDEVIHEIDDLIDSSKGTMDKIFNDTLENMGDENNEQLVTKNK